MFPCGVVGSYLPRCTVRDWLKRRGGVNLLPHEGKASSSEAIRTNTHFTRKTVKGIDADQKGTLLLHDDPTSEDRRHSLRWAP